MRIYRFIFLTIIFSSVAGVINGEEVDSIVVKYVDMRSEFPVSITCSEFGKDFFRDAYEVVIKDSKKIKKLMDATKSLPRSKDAISVETRAKIYIYQRGGEISTICMDASNLLIGDEIFDYTPEFWKVLSKHIPKKFFVRPAYLKNKK